MKPITWSLPKFMRLMNALGDGLKAAGLLEGIWHLTQSHHDETGLMPYSREELEASFRCELPEDIIQTLIDLRWLDERDGQVFVHDWHDHMPYYVQDRIKKRQRRSRDCPGMSQNVSDNPGKSDPSASASASHLKKPKKSAAAPLVFPDGLDVPEFKDAWGRWVAYRKEIKKPLTKSMVEAQLKKLNSMGLRHAVECIDHTIAMGWQGLRQPDTNGKSDGSHNAAAYNADLAKRVQATKEYLRR